MSLEDIKNRLAAATPGPWDWQAHDKAGARWSLEGKGEGILTCAAMLWPDEANAEFIAHAPEDIAYLLAEVERQRMRVKFFENAAARATRELNAYADAHEQCSEADS